MAMLAIAVNAADTITISGVVKDEAGEPLIGVSVKVKDTSKMTVTDLDGGFSLSGVNEGDEIVFTYVGYHSAAVKADRNRMEIILKENASILNEVVVVGYGTQKKVTLTGAVETVSAKNFQDKAVSNPALALQGVAPSLVVTRSTSRPGNEGIGMQIRGMTSVNGCL